MGFFKKLFKNRSMLLVLFVPIFCFCSTKSDEELLKLKMDKENLRAFLDDATQKYLEIKWDSAYYMSDHYIPQELHIYGIGKSPKYKNQTFKVEVVYNYIKETDSLDYRATHITHKELGEILSNYSVSIDTEDFMSPSDFERQLNNYRKWNVILKMESSNYATLANSNKTQIHFGMTDENYRRLQKEFKNYKQFEKNFIDGLIGSGTYEQTRSHNLQFVNGKLSLIEFHNTENGSLNYSNLEKYGRFVKDHSCTVNRYEIYESYYHSSIYNLKIYKCTTNNPPTNDISISIYWNGWLKLF